MKHKKSIFLAITFLMFIGLLQGQSNSGLIEISTNSYIIGIDRVSGDLKELRWKENMEVQVIKESRLGENFRLLMPLADYEANYFYSNKQKASKIEKINNGVICYYNNLKNERQELNVRVVYKIIEINRELQFSIDIDNPTSQPLAEVYYGIIGGQQGLLNRADNKTLITGMGWNAAPDLFNRFQAGGFGGGNLGITYSAGGFIYPGLVNGNALDGDL